MSDHYEQLNALQRQEQLDVLREIRNEINLPSLRDQIAIAAMQAYIALEPDCGQNGIAHDAYMMADYMIKWSKKKLGEHVEY